MKSGGWMILDAAETLFLTARQRVFGGEDKIGKRDDGKLSEIPPFEENPKWMALSEILEEIKEEVKKEGLENSFPSEKVLVLTTDERTMTQLQDYMALGAKGLLSRMFNKSLGENYGFIPLDDDGIDGPPVRKKSKNKGVGKKSKSSNNQTLTQMVAEKEEEKGEPEKEQLSVAESPVVMVHSMQSGVFELYKLLYSLHPSHVVMYDTNMSVVRQLEVYQANHPYKQLKVTFLMYDKSVDEQSYLTTLRKEKEAFESLIGEKATMVVPEYREGRGAEDNPDLARDGAKASDAIMESVNSRRAGGQKPDEKRAKVRVFKFILLAPKYTISLIRSSSTCVNSVPSCLR
jgi:DNA excision repair protein ERCC-4